MLLWSRSANVVSNLLKNIGIPVGAITNLDPKHSVKFSSDAYSLKSTIGTTSTIIVEDSAQYFKNNCWESEIAPTSRATLKSATNASHSCLFKLMPLVDAIFELRH